MNRFRLFVLSLVHGFVHGVMNIFPVVLEPIRHSFDWSLTSVSWVGTMGYVLFGFMALPGGWIADRFDRWILLRVMVVGMGGSLVLLGLWPSKIGFVVGWCMTCLFAGLYHPLGLSSVVTSGGDRTGEAMGWHGLGGNIGFATMPVLAGVIAGWGEWPYAFLTAGLIGGILVGLFFFITKTSGKPVDPSGDTAFPWSYGLVLILVMYGLVGFIYRGMVTFIPSGLMERWSTGMGLGYVGGLTTLVYLVGGVGQLAGGWFEDRYRSLRLFALLVGGYSVVIVGLFFAGGTTFLVLLMVWACLYFAGQPILNSLVSRIGIRSTHGRLYGVAFMMNLGLGASGAGITGSLIDRWGFFGGYVGIFTAGVVVLLILWLLSKQPGLDG